MLQQTRLAPPGFLLASCLLLLFVAAASAQSSLPIGADPHADPGLWFEENCGQADPEVRFLCRRSGFVALFTDAGVTLVLRRPVPGLRASRERLASPSPVLQDLILDHGLRDLSVDLEGEHAPTVVTLRVVGGNRAPRVVGEESSEGHSNYLLGPNPADWITGVSHHARVRYEAVYPGIDLVFYGRGGQLEYDFVLAPGATPEQIVVEIAGATSLCLEGEELVVATPSGCLVHRAPVATQLIDGARRQVPASYRLLSSESTHRYGFVVEHDPARELVIDPLLVYATFFGGNSRDWIGSGNNFYDMGEAMAVDSRGRLVFVGTTQSTDLPTTAGVVAPAQPAPAGFDGFVVKLNDTGTGVIWCTYLGGLDRDELNEVLVDAGDDIYVAGQTWSTTMPGITPSSFKSNLPPGICGSGCDQPCVNSDGYIAKLSADGSSVVSATYFGGDRRCAAGAATPDDSASALALDSMGNVVIGGYTQTEDLPLTPNAVDSQPDGLIAPEGFVAVLTPDLSGLVYSTYIGGDSLFDSIIDIVVLDDDILCAGSVGGAGSAHLLDGGAPCAQAGLATDIYLGRIDPRAAVGASLVWGRCLGGASPFVGQYPSAIITRSEGASTGIYLVGITDAPDLPQVNCLDCGLSGTVDAVLIRVQDDAGTFGGVTFSDYVGGDATEAGRDLDFDANGDLWLFGRTSSVNFPAVGPGAIQATLANPAGDSDFFLTRFRGDLSAQDWSTYYGGTTHEDPVGMATNAAGDFFLAGITQYEAYPTFGLVGPPLMPIDPDGTLQWDGLLARISFGLRIVSVQAPPTAGQGDTAVAIDLDVENTGMDDMTVDAVSLLFFDAQGQDVTSEYVVMPAPGNPTVIAAGTTAVFGLLVDVGLAATLGDITIDGFCQATDQVRGGQFTDRTADRADLWVVDPFLCTVSLCGDCNQDGMVSILDALLAAQMAGGLVPEPPLRSQQFHQCNVAGPAYPDPAVSIDILDALRLAQFAAGLLTLSCC